MICSVQFVDKSLIYTIINKKRKELFDVNTLKVFYSKYGCALQFVLILTWLTNLKESYAYFFTYSICALAGILCICDNYHNSEETVIQWKKMMIPSFVFSVAVILANHRLYVPILAIQSIFYIIIDCLGGIIIAGNVLISLCRKLPIETEIRGSRRNSPLRFFVLNFCSVAAIDFLFFAFSAYPGILTADSMEQIQQIHTGKYNNLNPFWHTQTIGVFVKLGKVLFGTYQAGVAMFSIFQILFVATCFAYVLTTLYQCYIPWGWIIGGWIVYALFPYNIAYSVTMWKDILFSMASLLLTTACYRLLNDMEKTRKLDMTLFVIGSFGLCLWRTNGLLAYGVLLIAMLCVAVRSKKMIKIMSVIFLICCILNGPVLSALGAEGGDYVEALSIPLQQVARVVHEGRTLEQEDWALIETIADEQTIRQEYKEYLKTPFSAKSGIHHMKF